MPENTKISLQSWGTIFSIIGIIGTFAWNYFTNSSKQMEDYKQKTSEEIHEVREFCQLTIQKNTKELHEYKLKTQERISLLESKLALVEQERDHLKNQYEHLHSQSDANDQNLRNEFKAGDNAVKSYVRTNFKTK